MAAPEQLPPAAEKKPGRGGLIIVILVALIVVGGLGFAGFKMLKKSPVSAGQAQAGAVDERPALYLQLDPAFVVNFKDDQALRFLQVGVNVMSRDPAAIQAAKDADPVIRNALLMLFSAQDFASLSDIKGKQKLQVLALAEIQRVVREKIGRPGIDAVYFTSFIMQ
jgi:flagellar FliL protein